MISAHLIRPVRRNSIVATESATFAIFSLSSSSRTLFSTIFVLLVMFKGKTALATVGVTLRKRSPTMMTIRCTVLWNLSDYSQFLLLPCSLDRACLASQPSPPFSSSAFCIVISPVKLPPPQLFFAVLLVPVVALLPFHLTKTL